MALAKEMSSTPLTDRQKRKDELSKKYQYLREKSKQKVRGKFIYHEVPGGAFEFCYGPIYKGDETEKYILTDGGVYELPLGVAQHLNKNVAYPEYGYIPAEGGNGDALIGGVNNMSQQGMRVKAMVRRVSFQSLEFLDIEDMPSNIVKVETIL